MSPADQRETQKYYELLVEGPPERSYGLLTGLHIAGGKVGHLYFSQDGGVRTPLGERLREIVHLHAGICHVIADDAVCQLLARYEKELVEHEVRVAEVREILSARFDFEFHAYSRRYGEEIRQLIASLPEGLEVTGGQLEETLDESAKGVEAYSPVHEYECEGSGSVRGRADLVIEARQQLGVHALVKVDSIELELA